jgi:hypothetical protein
MYLGAASTHNIPRYRISSMSIYIYTSIYFVTSLEHPCPSLFHGATMSLVVSLIFF